MTELVVWRHGRTEWNETGLFQGQTDVGLDGVGHEQARAAAAVLAPLLGSLPPATVVSSDLARARETAAYLGLPVTLDPRLREVDVGDWAGLTRDEVAARFPAEYEAWLQGEDVLRSGGETYESAGARAAAVVAEHAADGPLVLVMHGGVGRAMVLALCGLPPSGRGAFGVLGNARWATLARRPRGWRLMSYNEGAAVL